MNGHFSPLCLFLSAVLSAAAEVFAVTDAGFWGDFGPSNSVVGGTNVLFNSPILTAISYDDVLTATLNANCACGSNWTTGVTRTLTTCADCQARSVMGIISEPFLYRGVRVFVQC